MLLAAVAFVLAPGLARAADDPGDWYGDPIVDADVVLVGQAVRAGPGRMVNGCQYTEASVRVEEVLLGEIPSPAPQELTVEFVGDCRTVGTLGGQVPADRAAWFLISKGAWLRANVLPRGGDWSTEDAYWRPLRPDAIPVDRAGAVEMHGDGGYWIGAATFDSLVADLRQSAGLRVAYAYEKRPVGLGIWFGLAAYGVAAGLLVVALPAGVWAVLARGGARRLGLVIAGFAVVGAGVTFAGGPRLARSLDFAAVRQVYAPEAAALDARPGPPGMVFVHTQSFFSPDPYCGYEYARVPEALVLDPLGSGEGSAEDLGDGWYWLCAS